MPHRVANTRVATVDVVLTTDARALGGVAHVFVIAVGTDDTLHAPTTRDVTHRALLVFAFISGGARFRAMPGAYVAHLLHRAVRVLSTFYACAAHAFRTATFAVWTGAAARTRFSRARRRRGWFRRRWGAGFGRLARRNHVLRFGFARFLLEQIEFARFGTRVRREAEVQPKANQTRAFHAYDVLQANVRVNSNHGLASHHRFAANSVASRAAKPLG